MKRLFTCVDHDHIYPVGVASIVIADDETEAHDILQKALDERGLGTEYFSLQEVSLENSIAIILRDGNY